MAPRRCYNASQVVTAIRAYYRCNSLRKAATETGVPKSTIHEWVSKIGHRSKGSIRKRRVCKKLDAISPLVEGFLKIDPFHTLQSIQRAIQNSISLRVSCTTIHRAIHATKHSYKKVSWRTLPRDITQELAIFQKEYGDAVCSDRMVISLDETGFLTNYLPLRGYSMRGRRLRVCKEHPRRFRLTSIVAICKNSIVATDTFPGSANGKKFQDFISRVFAKMPNSIVLMDNIAFHKSTEVRRLAEAHGIRLLFTPPYSPECNPVEHFFAVVKSAVRRRLLYTTVFKADEFQRIVQGTLDELAASHCCAAYFGPRTKETAAPCFRVNTHPPAQEPPLSPVLPQET
jgi:putative transposase